eukprot:TRINITY_DN12408_c0_g1_i1.p1 TRINITY_DN12408_c0_g1~~TRINITY_DN12408_c0_g1_i1.p1  ORF type:complete len:484 (+),score=190.22 TRINITY_DN12408_c0_g1_i1:54-1454(+)
MSEKDEKPVVEAEEPVEEEEDEAKRAAKAAKNKAKKDKKKAKAAAGKDDDADKEEKIRQLAEVMIPNKARKDPNKKHKFWDKQPVLQLDKPFELGDREEALEKKSLEEVQKDPYDLPEGMEWWSPDVENDEHMTLIYELLRDHYVEDDDAMFRFNYTHEFLRWALLPPNHIKDWHVGIRSTEDPKIMIGFISGIPVNISARGNKVRMCEINFLCVNKNSRTKGLAPVLISEVTRRVNLKGIWQAIYTAGILITSTIAQCQYWHRSLNPQKLIQVGFSRIPPSFEKFAKPMDQVKRFYALPEKPKLARIRLMEKKDCKQVRALLEEYLEKFGVHQQWSNDEVAHWLLPKQDVIDSYVITNEEGKVTDFCSFYTLPSTVIGASKHKILKAAYCYYNVANTVSLADLLFDAMVFAKNKEHDVFNALDIMENSEIFAPLKFGMGDGHLRYYFYNWKFPQLKPSNIGIVLL